MSNLAIRNITDHYRTYILRIQLDQDRDISIGRLGNFHFKEGDYLYVGSAKKNIRQRIERHLRKRKRIFWHIDYLLQYADITKVWLGEKEESEIARILEARLEIPVAGFGSTDKIGDKSHLFYGRLPKKLLKEISLHTIFSF